MPGGGPDFFILHQVLIHQNDGWCCVREWCHAANDETRLRANEIGVGLAQRLSNQCGHFPVIDSIAAAGNHQYRSSIGCAKNNGFGNFTDVTTQCIGSGLRGMGRFWHGNDRIGETQAGQRVANA